MEENWSLFWYLNCLQLFAQWCFFFLIVLFTNNTMICCSCQPQTCSGTSSYWTRLMLLQFMSFWRVRKLPKLEMMLVEEPQVVKPFFLLDVVVEVLVDYLLLRVSVRIPTAPLNLKVVLMMKMPDPVFLLLMVLMTAIMDLIWVMDVMHLGIQTIQMTIMMIHGNL